MAQVTQLNIDQVNQLFYKAIDQALSCHLPRVLTNIIKEYHSCTHQMFSGESVVNGVDAFIGQGINSWVHYPIQVDESSTNFAHTIDRYCYMYTSSYNDYLFDVETKKRYNVLLFSIGTEEAYDVFGSVLGVIKNNLYRRSGHYITRHNIETGEQLFKYKLCISGVIVRAVGMGDSILLFQRANNRSKVYNVYKITETNVFLMHGDATYSGCDDYTVVGDRILFLGGVGDPLFYFWRDNKVVFPRWSLPMGFKRINPRIHYNSEEQRLYIYQQHSVYYCEPFDKNGNIQTYVSWQILTGV